VAGSLDQAGGLAFAVRDADHYFVLRLNALEGNVVLFEFRHGRREAKRMAERPLALGEWHRLQVELQGKRMAASLDGEPLFEFEADEPLSGHVGLWTKTDSTTWFEDLVIEDRSGRRVAPI
jgi:pyruvate,water dikinase